MDEKKLSAWIEWCISAHLFSYITDQAKLNYAEGLLKNSSHGKAFSYAWDKAIEAIGGSE